MSKQPKPLKLFETAFVGRLETYEEVQKALADLSNLEQRIRWRIISRQTRQQPEKKKEQAEGRKWIA